MANNTSTNRGKLIKISLGEKAICFTFENKDITSSVEVVECVSMAFNEIIEMTYSFSKSNEDPFKKKSFFSKPDIVGKVTKKSKLRSGQDSSETFFIEDPEVLKVYEYAMQSIG